MRTWTKTAGVLFLAAASVYTTRAIAEATGTRVSQPTHDVIYAAPEAPQSDVKLIEEPATTTAAGEADPFASTQPATAPSEGQSVNSTDVTMSDSGTVEIHVNDANLVEVLRMLSLQSQKNIIASKEVRGTVTANLYDVTVSEALDAILHANGYAYREKGNFIYVYTAKELAEIEKAEQRVQTRVFRLFYTPAVNAQNMIKPVLSDRGQVAVSMPALSGIDTGTADSDSGSGSGSTNTGGNDHATEDMLVVTDYPENLERVAQLIGEIDRRPQQILLEAVILRATLNEDNALGIDFNVVSGVDLSAATFSNSGQITGAGTNGGGDPAAHHVSGVGTGTNFSNAVPGGLKVGLVTQNISVFLSALEQVTDTTILANPKILALNKQQGEVFVGNENGYKTSITTETSVSETVETLKTGTRLVFRPFIAADGYIRMEVHPEDSAGEVNPITQLPNKSTTEVTSNIMVKDGHTIVIGGLFRDSTVSGRSQVPLLGSIPVAGALFRSQRDKTVREEVVILLTPHIIKDDAAYSRLSEQELAEAEKVRVGGRKGTMPIGRERLAEGAFEKARAELNKPKPNRKKALWHLNVATALNPRMTDAIDLREQVTGEEVTMADGSSIRSFVRKVMIEDSELAAPPATMPTTRPGVVLPDNASSAKAKPATQPSLAAAPATQPSLAAAPATQPSLAEAPATQPAESDTSFAAAPTSQPAHDADAHQVTVTELPLDDAAPGFDGGSDVEFESDGMPLDLK